MATDPYADYYKGIQSDYKSALNDVWAGAADRGAVISSGVFNPMGKVMDTYMGRMAAERRVDDERIRQFKAQQQQRMIDNILRSMSEQNAFNIGKAQLGEVPSWLRQANTPGWLTNAMKYWKYAAYGDPMEQDIGDPKATDWVPAPLPESSTPGAGWQSKLNKAQVNAQNENAKTAAAQRKALEKQLAQQAEDREREFGLALSQIMHGQREVQTMVYKNVNGVPTPVYETQVVQAYDDPQAAWEAAKALAAAYEKNILDYADYFRTDVKPYALAELETIGADPMTQTTKDKAGKIVAQTGAKSAFTPVPQSANVQAPAPVNMGVNTNVAPPNPNSVWQRGYGYDSPGAAPVSMFAGSPIVGPNPFRNLIDPAAQASQSAMLPSSHTPTWATRSTSPTAGVNPFQYVAAAPSRDATLPPIYQWPGLFMGAPRP